jgi:hypothetical protein
MGFDSESGVETLEGVAGDLFLILRIRCRRVKALILAPRLPIPTLLVEVDVEQEFRDRADLAAKLSEFCISVVDARCAKGSLEYLDVIHLEQSVRSTAGMKGTLVCVRDGKWRKIGK